MATPRTLSEKVWDRHVVRTAAGVLKGMFCGEVILPPALRRPVSSMAGLVPKADQPPTRAPPTRLSRRA